MPIYTSTNMSKPILPNANRNTQRGATAGEWLFIIIGALFLLLIGFKLGKPIYENYQANQVIKTVIDALPAQDRTDKVVNDKLGSAFQVAGLPFAPQDVLSVRTLGGHVYVAKKYERRVKFWGPVDVVITFDSNYDTDPDI